MSDKEEKGKYSVEFISSDTHFLNVVKIKTIRIGNNNILSVAYVINYLCIQEILEQISIFLLNIHIHSIIQCLLNYNYMCIPMFWNYLYFSLALRYCNVT